MRFLSIILRLMRGDLSLAPLLSADWVRAGGLCAGPPTATRPCLLSVSNSRARAADSWLRLVVARGGGGRHVGRRSWVVSRQSSVVGLQSGSLVRYSTVVAVGRSPRFILIKLN